MLLCDKLSCIYRLHHHNDIVGSPYWMAPECLYGKPYAEKADVFSYGIILAEIMARIPADPEYMPRTNVSTNVCVACCLVMSYAANFCKCYLVWYTVKMFPCLCRYFLS